MVYMGRKPRIPRVTVQCQNCGKDFKVLPSTIKNGGGKYCSKKCKQEGMRKKVKRTCPVCGKEFEVWPSKIKWGKGTYCSARCRYDDAKTGEMRDCKICGKSFYVSRYRIEHGQGIYCSYDCRAEDEKTRITKSCKYCGKEFETHLCEIKKGRGKYCSKECADKDRSTLIEKMCEHCGKPFLVPRRRYDAKYCSFECYDATRPDNVIRTCHNCGKKFEVEQSQIKNGKGRFCSKECFYDWNHGENNPIWKGGISYEPYCPKFDKAKREEVRNEWGHICAGCGKTEHENRYKLGVHHIDYDKEQGCNGKDFFLIPLCTSCHGKSNQNRALWIKKLTKKYNEHEKQ